MRFVKDIDLRRARSRHTRLRPGAAVFAREGGSRTDVGVVPLVAMRRDRVRGASGPAARVRPGVLRRLLRVRSSDWGGQIHRRQRAVSVARRPLLDHITL